ncbi:MAG: TauD/TfdA family dioxygenase [Rhodovibrionaceae bacterium]
MQVAAEKIKTRKLSEHVGAEIIGIDLRDPVSEEVFEQILQAWYDNCVILLRGQDLSEDQQWEFGTRFGPLSGGHISALEAGRRGVVYISNVREGGKLKGILPDGEMQFHSDQCYHEQPSQGTMLHAITIPKSGGNTMFANCYKAYETLPEDLRNRVDGLKALNVYDYNLNPTQRATGESSAAPSYVHPVVRTHSVTGRKALYVNRLMTARIEGLPAAESEQLLSMLFDHIEQREFIYEHIWKVGDVLLWDNRCVLHARTDFDPSETRLLRRITLKGEPVS